VNREVQLKDVKQHFLLPTPTKKVRNDTKLWRTYQTAFSHAKPLQKRAIFWNFA